MDVSYWEGWDPEQRRTIGRLPMAVAHERDSAGEQYTVLVETSDVPRALIDIAWSHYYCAVWVLDEQLRRTEKYEFRRLDPKRLFLQNVTKWEYANAEQPEFDSRAGTQTIEAQPDGMVRAGAAPHGEGGGSTEIIQQVPAEQLWGPAPDFGDWRDLVAGDPQSTQPPDLVVRPDPDEPDATLPADQRPWRPPEPLRPSRPELTFHPGTRYDIPDAGRATVEVVAAGTLHMPTGRPLSLTRVGCKPPPNRTKRMPPSPRRWSRATTPWTYR
jgi:hypothetical protein